MGLEECNCAQVRRRKQENPDYTHKASKSSDVNGSQGETLNGFGVQGFQTFCFFFRLVFSVLHHAVFGFMAEDWLAGLESIMSGWSVGKEPNWDQTGTGLLNVARTLNPKSQSLNPKP